VFIVETVATAWIVLLLVVAAAAAVRTVRAMPRRAARPAPPGADPETERVALATAQAVAAAARRRAEWLRAQERLDAAWSAFDAADRQARRCAGAAVFPVLRQRRTPAEIADRERNLHRLATAACRRKELSIGQLNDILAHRDGWNPRRHPVAQEASLHAATREFRYAAYRAAVERERRSWQDMERATVTLRSLRAESLLVRAHAGRDLRPVQPRVPAPRAKARLAVH
jgi:hypothetical protein